MNKVLAAFAFIKARLSEPSTMVSLSIFCALAGKQIDVAAIQAALSVGTLVFGTMGFFIKEATPK